MALQHPGVCSSVDWIEPTEGEPWCSCLTCNHTWSRQTSGEMLLYCWRLCYLILLYVMTLVRELIGGGMGDEFGFFYCCLL